MTKLIDQKLKSQPTSLAIYSEAEHIPFVDESPQKHSDEALSCDKENIPRNDLYKNPSLHKSNQYHIDDKLLKEKQQRDKEKDQDTRENAPDNERHLLGSAKLTVKVLPLRRSESLNKSNNTASSKPDNNKLKRSDSLTKTEKTESNINKRRELSLSNKRNKDSTSKHKRKNGMPDRSIKRRHTVGGTKDPDKVTWVLDSSIDSNNCVMSESGQEKKNLRTSSPDLSSTRRERLLFEINLFGRDNNMVVALRQHLVGGRPQSFPESTTVYKMPLESHV